ncbi:hypothetical protein [Robertmurraya siralis]|uniref:hypothetical protein n=1 Tax=Robertmurraya siralis TaxID=77777 RepID=UPI0010F59F91|nr:hypothetical protein [Robertmurraya siralis]
MTTEYRVIFDKFIKKLKGDNSFFDYKDLSEEEINEIVHEHLLSLLNRSIDKIYSFGSPDIDFYDKDDENQVFNAVLIPQEISLLSELMYFLYLEEDKNKLKSLGIFFRTSEINVFSPANERKSYLDMIDKEESRILNLLSNYLSRDRETWTFKSVYGGN